MSHRRSGLLSGLIVGFVAMLIGVAGYAAMVAYSNRLPYDVRWFAGNPGLVFPVACCLLAGLILGLAVWVVRPRSLLLPWVVLLYAFGVRAGGDVAGIVVWAVDKGFPLATWFPDNVDRIAQGVWTAMRTSWQFWAAVGAAAVPAFLLTVVRVARVRRRWRAEAGVVTHRGRDGGEQATDAMEAEPEYRAPFEPLQPPKATPAAPTANLFAPREPGQS
ncbi:hypothetical protein GCM10010149_08690 [Nonomuraea roseoviolacea subsp. roseoviolacea]|uniref:DUF3995 domain-containing protein n=1 Tax=Nonomuraea roseoviolacea subsp. carminata TaxID=160689 RepID=A0ABT1KCV7_9ACTN|nr:hypothetical protein [Nonomuraea roseoviolacea]MCP2350809.1 hypothetical protein [Nonomuraea roseoviolacea subsp. carminata]